jgi:four helix bundle protein
MEIAEKLPETCGARHLATQIIRSATSPALNYGEAQGAESREDFIHKMKICQK